MTDKFPITASGYKKMSEELHELIANRAIISERIAEAREHGDLKENAEYHAAREQQGFNEAKISDLEDKISRSQVIDVSKLSTDTVKFGAFVTLLDDDTEKEVKYQLVSEYETDIKNKKISVTSPLAKAIIGKKVGDIAEFNTPKGEKIYEIIKISLDENS